MFALLKAMWISILTFFGFIKKTPVAPPIVTPVPGPGGGGGGGGGGGPLVHLETARPDVPFMKPIVAPKAKKAVKAKPAAMKPAAKKPTAKKPAK